MWRRNSDTSPVIRTDFAHDDEWTRVRAAIVAPQTLTHHERPILVVNLYDWVEELEDTEDDGRGPRYGATFRVIPAEMWSVQNNLSLLNMDWSDFADSVDDDGIFRGFG